MENLLRDLIIWPKVRWIIIYNFATHNEYLIRFQGLLTTNKQACKHNKPLLKNEHLNVLDQTCSHLHMMPGRWQCYV